MHPFRVSPSHVFPFQDKHEELGLLCKCSLAIRENALDPYHPDVAIMLDNRARLLIYCSSAVNFALLDDTRVALFFRFQGNFADADQMYLRAIEIEEKALGPDHPNLAKRLNNRAELLKLQVRAVGMFLNIEVLSFAFAWLNIRPWL